MRNSRPFNWEGKRGGGGGGIDADILFWSLESQRQQNRQAAIWFLHLISSQTGGIYGISAWSS